MKHHGHIHFIENTGLSQAHFAATTFFGRCSDDRHATGLISQDLLQYDGSAQAGGGDQIVTTAVADLG